MIKNVVFDMGKVLVNYDADIVCRRYIEDEAMRKEVCTSVFVSPEWLMLDMGVMEEDMALKKMQQRLDSDEARERAALCFRDWHLYNMWPIEEMGEVVTWLKDKGYGVYLCSNASVRLLDCYQIIPGIELFDGILFSAEVKCMKPQAEMYKHLFERFHLKPEECFFIDDLQLNIDGAKACGMDGYCFEDGDIGKLRTVLTEMGKRQ